ncbi:hypothetical protein [Pseudaestuariivita sp.]|uniref:hypothetical protein n=1 Tax=Pseudaestuariivita sp. TaxID=2211669 RepID=UPI004058A821
MLGLRLFRHAVLMLIDNLGPAFRVSLLPAAIFGLAAYLSFASFASGIQPDGTVSNGQLLVIVVFALLALGVVIFCWVATAWHRYVLLEEQPGAALPKWHGDAVKRYLGASLRVIGMTMLVGIPLLVLFAAFGGGSFSTEDSSIASIAFNFLVSYVSLRFSMVLPAAAIGTTMTVMDSWRATSGFAWAILLANLLVNLLVGIPGLIAGSLLGSALAAGSYYLVAGWLQLMLSISLLTALYGHIVEGRALR